MTSVEAWNVFKNTGNIFDYIVFSRIRSFEEQKKE